MKLLIIHNILWSHYKNALFSELHKQSQKQGINIKVLQMARNEQSRASFETTDKSFLEVNYPFVLLFDNLLENISSFELFKAILSKINEFKPDVVNITGFYSWVHLATIAYCKLYRIKVIMSNDSTRGDNLAVGWKEVVKKKIISWCDGFFCFGSLATQYMLELGASPKKILANHCGVVDNQKIIDLYNQAKLNSHQLDLPNHNFIYVGRFFEQKNLLMLLDAFQESQHNYQDWGLILLGGGEQKKEIEQYINQKSIRNVFLIDGKPWYEVPSYLALADVLVLPSKSEPWGLVVNEAMLCKMPVIVSNKCGCYVDLVQQGKNGFVFNYQSKEELSQYLSFFIEKSVEVKEMGKLSFELIQKYSIENAATEMINGLKKIYNENS